MCIRMFLSVLLVNTDPFYIFGLMQTIKTYMEANSATHFAKLEAWLAVSFAFSFATRK
jgi:hypothetical protein